MPVPFGSHGGGQTNPAGNRLSLQSGLQIDQYGVNEQAGKPKLKDFPACCFFLLFHDLY